MPSDDDFLRKYPAQMSVGQAQRVLIAMAVVHRPALLIADEATSALDVITQAEILKLFRELNQNSGMAILYISHDLASVAGICDRVAILHQGEIVESGSTQQVLTTPSHEYTRRLLASLGSSQSGRSLSSPPRFASHLNQGSISGAALDGQVTSLLIRRSSSRRRILYLYFGTTCPVPPPRDRLTQPDLDSHPTTSLFSAT